MNEATLDALQQFLDRHIPLTVAMQVKAQSYDGQHLVLTVPLAANHNDKGTAFAGSISSLATVCGWSALMLWSKEHYGDCQVAVSHADIQYKKPILGDFHAKATLPSKEALQHLHKTLSHKGRGRAQLHIEVADEHGIAMVLTGCRHFRH